MNDPSVNLDLAIEHGLSSEEFDLIHSILKRTPTFVELGIFSVMWSEHCSYKSSIKMLKTLPRSGGRMLVEAGEENAGLIDIGDNRAVSFKIESHNHPSAVEPYQGAATGVGGILRDIFTMGARPIACLNSLRFGSLDSNRNRFLLEHVVAGIGDYGNCVGIPTVGGEVVIEDSYSGNPLVNAMTVGIVNHDDVISATAHGVGNPVFLVGATTGRDGVHGATFASVELTEESALGDMLFKLFHNKVNDNDLSIDEYRALYEAYKNPPTVKEETPPPSPFPWINSEFVGAGWKKR